MKDKGINNLDRWLKSLPKRPLRLVDKVYWGVIYHNDGSSTQWHSKDINHPVILSNPIYVEEGKLLMGFINKNHWVSEWHLS